jgi:O-antigen ligase
MIANGAMLAMTVSLLWKSNSMTSLLCFLASGTVILLASCTWIVRRPVVLHLLLAGFVLALCAVYVFNLDEVILKMVGRSPTFTGRTDMWKVFLKIAGNPWVGTGFQSFWLGERMQKVLRAFPEHWYNQAHNGYLEVFLNLGWIGVVLLALLLAHGYRRIVAAYRTSPYIGSLWLGYFVAALLENFTEAEFRLMSPVWIMSLLAIVWASAARDSEERVGENSSLINMQSWYISSPTWARTSGPAGETVKVSHSWKCPVAHHR